MAAFCSVVNFLRDLTIGIILESGHIKLISENFTF